MSWTTFRITVEIAIPTFIARYWWAISLIALLALLLVIRGRRRAAEERKLKIMSSVQHDFFPQGEHPAIEEFRREVDASHERWKRERLEERWRRDGSVMLEKRKGAP